MIQSLLTEPEENEERKKSLYICGISELINDQIRRNYIVHRHQVPEGQFQ